MPERLMKQGYDSDTQKDRVGQEIDARGGGKLAPPCAAKVRGEVSRNAPNFNRATIPVASPNALGQHKRDWELIEEAGNGERSFQRRDVMQGAVDSSEAPGPDKEPRSNTKKRAGKLDHK